MLICPECGKRLHVASVVTSPDGEETWRLLKCAHCKRKCYSVEFLIDDNARSRGQFNRAKRRE